jgi:hypothetical protein
MSIMRRALRFPRTSGMLLLREPAPRILLVTSQRHRVSFSSSTESSTTAPVCVLSPDAPWTSLSLQHRAALEHLGYTSHSWDAGGGAPPVMSLPFDKLSLQQQSIVHHGMGMSAELWDDFRRQRYEIIQRQRALMPKSPSSAPQPPVTLDSSRYAPAVSSSPLASVARTVASAAASFVRTVAPAVAIVSPMFSNVKHPAAVIGGLLDAACCASYWLAQLFARVYAYAMLCPVLLPRVQSSFSRVLPPSLSWQSRP